MKLTYNWFFSSSSSAHDSKSWRCNNLLENLAVAAPAVTRHDKTTAIFSSFVCSWPHAVVVWRSKYRDAGGGGDDDWIFFSFVRKGRDRRKKERKKDSATFCVFLSFFLSLMGQQLQSPAAATALCTLPKRALPRAQVRERERDILQTPTYCS